MHAPQYLRTIVGIITEEGLRVHEELMRVKKEQLDLTKAKVWTPQFRIYDLRSTYATRLSAGGIADGWVTSMLRQGDAKVFKKYAQIELQVKREALEKLNRRTNEMPAEKAAAHSDTVTVP